jgi:N4-(beta-N-acetylglucosaminyl)-L-asparaginase
MRGTAALAAAAAGGGPASAQGAKPIVISSANGLAACKRAMEMLHSGADTLDAVIAGVNIVELDPNDHSVGYGGLPNEEGVVELDASVIHGPSRMCGSVASIRGIKTPSKIAKLVMTDTDHVMLVGDGALKFAKEMGYPEEDLLVDDSRKAWVAWKKSLRDKAGHNNWTNEIDAGIKSTAGLRQMFPDESEKTLAWIADVITHPPTGTINCLSLNSKGEMSGVTTTSGLAWKIAGRVGDSPIIGAGLYLDQDVGGAGSTGRGEENIRIAGAHTIVENMRHGMTPKEACLDALKRVARNFNNDKSRLGLIDINFYALRKDGMYAGTSLWDKRDKNATRRARFAVNDGGESRLEDCASLYDRT